MSSHGNNWKKQTTFNLETPSFYESGAGACYVPEEASSSS
jgi:hypothetical protein